MFGTLFDLANLAISVCLPLVGTYKAIDNYDSSAVPVSGASLKPWLVYWVVFALLTIAETRFAFLLQYLPLVGLFRIYLAVWLLLPQTKGADFVYYTYVAPFVALHEEKVERVVKCAAEPIELIRVVAEYFGLEINLSRFSAANAANHRAGSVTSGKKYLDSFFTKFIDSDPVQKSHVATLVGEGGLVDSLLGVMKHSVPKGNSIESKSLHSKTSSDSISVKSLNNSGSHSATSSGESNDYDVVGREELANFVENKSGSEIGADKGTQSQGWFGWWTQDKSKTE